MIGPVVVVGILALVAVGLYLKEKTNMPKKPLPDLPQEPRSSGGEIYSSRFLTAQQRAAADLIVSAAIDADINAPFMIALAVTESSLDPSRIGDDGISLGLFQMNKKFISASNEELLDAQFNTDAALEKLRGLVRSFPGNSYGDYAEAWTLGGAGRFKKLRRNPQKWTHMQKAIDDLSLDLSLTDKP